MPESLFLLLRKASRADPLSRGVADMEGAMVWTVKPPKGSMDDDAVERPQVLGFQEGFGAVARR
ncbi:MAG: hypothetical protein OXC54_03940 [Rhodospirillaceae bacterium]|nr:hypothetical protein [Rhodospirillaceae bacterium]